MQSTDTIFEEALRQAGISIGSASSDGLFKLSPEQIDHILRGAYNAGIRDGRRSLFREEEDMPAQLFRQLMESLPDHVYFKDLQSRFICANRSMALYFGLKDASDIVGKSDFDFFAPESARKKFEAEQEIIRTGVGWSFREERDVRGDIANNYVISSKLPLRDANGHICGTFGLSRDITKQKTAEREVLRQRRLLETIIQILPCRLFLRNREGQFLLVNEEYRRCLGLPPEFEIVGKRLADIIDDPRVDRILAEDLRVIETGEPIANKLEFDQSFLTDHRWVLTSKVPLRSENGETEGIVGMSLDITEQKRAEDIARKAKEALQAKNELYEEELLVARQLQEQLMSMGFNEKRIYSKRTPQWDFQACYLYSPSHHLAGDFFYLLPIDETKVGLLVCDVMGHGVKAALVTMLIRGLMSEIPRMLDHPSRVLQHLNETIISLAEDEEFPRFVTAVYMTIDLATGDAAIANAGHPSPIFHHRNQHVTPYEDCPCAIIGPALGLLGGEPFGDTRFKFDSSTEIYFFTDGIIEQITTNGPDFGRQGLVEALQSTTSELLNEQLDRVNQRLSAALDDKPVTDDICVIALRVTPA